MSTNTFLRLAKSYTCFNLLLIMVSAYVVPLQGVAAANTLLVAIAVTLVLRYTTPSSILLYFKSLWPSTSTPAAVILHVLLHYIPLLYTGVRFKASQGIIAVAIFWTWYTIVHDYIVTDYIDSISLESYVHVALISSCFTILWGMKYTHTFSDF